MARIRSGHTYDKKFLYLMKKVNDNICMTCNVLEDSEHVIITCNQYNTNRAKYKALQGNKTLTEILTNEKQDEYEQICAFLKEIKSNI